MVGVWELTYVAKPVQIGDKGLSYIVDCCQCSLYLSPGMTGEIDGRSSIGCLAFDSMSIGGDYCRLYRTGQYVPKSC